jgi:hypothetical protein
MIGSGVSSIKTVNAKVYPQEGFHNLKTVYPGMESLCLPISSKEGEQAWMDHAHRLTHVHPHTTGRSCPLTFSIERNVTESGIDIMDVSGFRKVTHILDPEVWLKNQYTIPTVIPETITPETYGEAAWTKMNDVMNHAYIETLAAFALGKLREKDVSPHFHLFYGAFTGIADTYTYNITDTYMTYRASKWFWDSHASERFKIGFDEEVPEEVRQSVCEKPEDVYEDSDNEDVVLVDESIKTPVIDETASLKSAEDDDFTKNSDSEEDEEEDDESDDEEPLTIYAEIKNFPVMTIFTEVSESTMDSLLDDYEEVGAEPGDDKWELIWTAWIFQVVAALSAAQGIFSFTHNDLHSNNIVWSTTKEEFLYYKTRVGTVYKVPTYGKVFRIIDFGRAIFKIGDRTFFSDDFRKNNEADEMYNFGELYDEEECEVNPNPSFDLCRFTVSIFESLFPETPSLKKKAKILSSEPGLIVRETVSPLYNLLWQWLICDDGHNVLMNPDRSERYPDFDLYKVIAAEVHGAVPSFNLDDEAFQGFILHNEKIPTVKIYSLFC